MRMPSCEARAASSARRPREARSAKGFISPYRCVMASNLAVVCVCMSRSCSHCVMTVLAPSLSVILDDVSESVIRTARPPPTMGRKTMWPRMMARNSSWTMGRPSMSAGKGMEK